MTIDTPQPIAAPATRDAAIGVWRAFRTRDPGLIRAVLSDDAEWIAPRGNATAVALGVTDHMVGADAIVAFICQDFDRLFVADVAMETLGVFCDGPVAVFEQRLTATLANDRAYDNLYCFVLEMAGPRLKRVREYMDTRRGQAMVFGDEAPRQIVPDRGPWDGARSRPEMASGGRHGTA